MHLYLVAQCSELLVDEDLLRTRHLAGLLELDEEWPTARNPKQAVGQPRLTTYVQLRALDSKQLTNLLARGALDLALEHVSELADARSTLRLL